jgi:Arc/MetJ-type ribon-helix-helix transcriptional regulator
MTKPPIANVGIPRKQYEAVQDFINAHPEMGYDSVSQAVKEAIRQWLHKKKLEETHFTVESKNEIELNGH